MGVGGGCRGEGGGVAACEGKDEEPAVSGEG